MGLERLQSRDLLGTLVEFVWSGTLGANVGGMHIFFSVIVAMAFLTDAPSAFAGVARELAKRCGDVYLGGTSTQRAAPPTGYEVIPWEIGQHKLPGIEQVREKIDDEDRLLWAESVKNGGREVGRFRAFSPKGNLIYAGDFIKGEMEYIDQDKADGAFTSFLKTIISIPVRPEVATIKFKHTHPPRFWVYNRRAYGFFPRPARPM